MQPASPAAADLIGAVLGGAYRVQSLIDRGSMGAVYRAEHLRLRRPVAVKVMAAHMVEQPGALDRFTREAEIISRLNHPHIVQVLDFDTTEQGQPFLVMELLEGKPLDVVVELRGKLDLRVALRIAVQAASGLAAAHAAGVVHRDLKPGNIFLVDAGDQLFVKLLDFGISKQHVAQKDADRKLTGEFDILGTPEYMPPEQALGRTATVDHRGDQYALGVILYEMLVGRPPFLASDIMALLQKVIRDRPEPLSALRPDVPQAVADAILRALSKAPEDRFTNVAEFADVLDLTAAELRTIYPGPKRSSDLESLGMVTPLKSPSSRPPPDTERQDPDPTKRTSWHSKDPVKAVRELLDRARQELGFDNHDLALNCADSAVEIARSTNNDDVKALVAQHSKFLERIFLRRLGTPSTRFVTAASRAYTPELTPEQAFLLSRFDQSLSVDEVLDLVPWPHEQTLSHLVALVRAGYVTPGT